jgi:hypothetical protein
MRLISLNFFFVTIVLGLIFISNNVYAQDPIATERPTQSIGSLVLPGNSFQFEQGFTYKSDTLELDGFFRLGVSDIGELRLFTYYDSPLVTIGAKVNLLKDKNYRPGIAIRVELTGAKVSDYRLAIMQKLSEQFSATINVGYTDTSYGILAIGYSFADRFGAYLEGYFEKDYTQLNTGLTFAVNSETQLDINTGLLNFDGGYLTVGFARRFMFKKQE